MKILVVNPAEYGFTDMISRASLISTPRIASLYKGLGHEVCVFNIRPDLISRRCFGGNKNCHRRCDDPKSSCKNPWRLIGEELYYKGESLLTVVGNRKCGNWESERCSRKLVRIGRPLVDYSKKLLSFKPDVVAISQIFTYLWEGVKETVDITRRVLPGTEIWVGGIYPTLCPEHAEKLGADRIVRKQMGCTDDFTRIDLSVCEEPPVLVGLFTQLGCPNDCGYCAVPGIEGRKQIRRDPGDVLDEIDYYVSKDVRTIEFLDSNLLVDYERHFKLILEGIVKRDYKITLKSYGGVEAKLLTQPILELMVKAGFNNISVPIESASPELLQRWDRKLLADAWRERLGDLGREIFINSFVMIGCLEQTARQAEDTVKIVEEMGIAPIPLPFTPIPGTREHVYAEERFGRKFTLEELHPILFPLAHDGFTVNEMNTLYKRFHLHSLQNHGNVHHRGIINESERHTVPEAGTYQPV